MVVVSSFKDMQEIVIFGCGGHAKVVYDIVLKQNKFKPVAFVSDSTTQTNYLGLPHIRQSDFADFHVNSGIVAIGDNWVRSQIVSFITGVKKQFQFVTAIHPSAQIGAEVKIGDGVVVMPLVCINSGTQVYDHVILNTHSSIDHDCQIGNYASIAPGVAVGGNCEIGDHSAISIGATVIHGRMIGKHSVVGAGSVVIKNIGEFEVAYGVPCKVIRKRTQGEKYL